MTRARHRPRAWQTLAVGIGALACASGGPRGVPPAAASARDEPRRSGAECDSVVWRAVMTEDSTKVFPPTPKHTQLVPPAISEGLRGRTLRVRFRVNEAGRPDLAGTIITGRIEQRYLEAFTATLRKWEFAPAVLDGCAVPGSTEITFSFP